MSKKCFQADSFENPRPTVWRWSSSLFVGAGFRGLSCSLFVCSSVYENRAHSTMNPQLLNSVSSLRTDKSDFCRKVLYGSRLEVCKNPMFGVEPH